MRNDEQPDATIDGDPYPMDWLEIKTVWLDLFLAGAVSKEAFLLSTESIDYARMTGRHITKSEMEAHFKGYDSVLAGLDEVIDAGLCRWSTGKQGVEYIFFADAETWPLKVEEPPAPS